MPKPPLMERSIFALTHILVEALPDIRWTRLMALRTGNFMARKLLSNAQAIAEQSEFEGQNFGFSPVTKPQQNNFKQASTVGVNFWFLCSSHLS